MISNELPYNLTSVGYLIVQDPEEAREHDEYRRTFGRYCGVDRLPPFIPPDREVRALLGEPLVQDERFFAALDEWFDARPETTAFIADDCQAFRLFETLRSFDFRLELLYCELAWNDEEEERRAAYVPVMGSPPVVSKTYGFDVSWPRCNHSAILQPGAVPNNPRWRGKLNNDGLLDDYKDALRLREEYLNVYPYPPFDVYLIHRVT
jgi:hypothetical protein